MKIMEIVAWFSDLKRLSRYNCWPLLRSNIPNEYMAIKFLAEVNISEMDFMSILKVS